ncbi:MAG: LacI family transcriptional regulator, partial [Burkholderiales bacterium PBB5]
MNIATLTVVVTLYGPGAARSQAAAEYPSRPVTIIVPAPPGGLADGLARALAAPLAKALKQAVVVDNKPGAAGVLATGFVAKAAPDGHTLLLSGDAHPVSGMLYKLPYDPIKDFVAVAPLATWPLVLIAAPGLDARTVPELVTLAKAKPGRLTVASTGTGSSSQLAAEVFKAT